MQFKCFQFIDSATKNDKFDVIHCDVIYLCKLDARLTSDQEVAGSTPPGRQQIDHEIFSTVLLSLQLIQEGQLSVSGERMCTILVNRLEN